MPEGCTLVTSPQARTVDWPVMADSEGATEALGSVEAPGDDSVAGDAGAPDSGAIDSVDADGPAEPAGERMAIAYGVPVSSPIEIGTVEVEVPPETSSSWNCAPDAGGASDAADASTDAAGAEASADADGAADAAPEGVGPVVQSPANRTAGIAIDMSPPTTPMTTVV